MASYPKLPGMYPTQDLDSINFRRVSALKQESLRAPIEEKVSPLNLPHALTLDQTLHRGMAANP
jgi:hypothetical protein